MSRTREHRQSWIFLEARIGLRQFAQQEYRPAIRSDPPRMDAIRAQAQRNARRRSVRLVRHECRI